LETAVFKPVFACAIGIIFEKGKAIKYANASCGLKDNPAEFDRVCEEILLSSGLYNQAYQQYGLVANLGRTNLATFRNIAKKYPMKEKSQILQNSVNRWQFSFLILVRRYGKRF